LHGCRVVLDEVSVAAPRKSHGRGVLADGSGEAAEGPAAAGGVGLAFQSANRGEANTSLISQFLLGQAALPLEHPANRSSLHASTAPGCWSASG
jgi:hypothetical protein